MPAIQSTPSIRWPGRAGALLVVAVALAALALQYLLLIRATLDTVGPGFATVRYFSFFTVLSNLLVVAAAGRAALRGHGDGQLSQPRVQAAVALYIGVTGLVYVTVLRHLWHPQGLQWWADCGLHYATPLLYLSWWALVAPHGRLAWRDLPAWLLFPAGYVLWVFLRGAVVHEYPYPFLDVDQHGWGVVIGNAVVVLGVFVAVGAVLVGVDRMLGRGRA
ncbi:Pr6Pr family membrane protein [Lysobacter cavernae]|uniref:Pr6Pr family membrane protein n=1 Tax=Lysobacter cavernae TaxID=1685901 RepID=A0ABV7RM37_9GAMM